MYGYRSIFNYDVGKHVGSSGNLQTERIKRARVGLTRVGAARSVRLHWANQCARLHLDIAPGSRDNGRRTHIRDRASLSDCISRRGTRARGVAKSVRCPDTSEMVNVKVPASGANSLGH